MANIPIERAEGGSFWPWLLGLVAVLFVVWLAFEMFDDEPDLDELAGADDNVGIIDDAELGDDADGTLRPTSIAEPFALNRLRVERVIGDRTFIVTSPNATTQTLVLLDQEPSPNTPGIEGQVDVNAGQVISIDGSFRDWDDGMMGKYGLTESALQGVDRYRVIHANSVNILQSELDNVEVQ